MKLIITDIDGTLLDHYGDLPPGNAEALVAALDRGARLALATIRKRDSTERVAQQLGLPCTLVCQGGAAIYDEWGTALRTLTIPLDLARAVAGLADEQCLPLLTTVDELNYYTLGAQPTKYIASSWREVRSNLEALVGPPTRFIVRGPTGIELLMATFAA